MDGGAFQYRKIIISGRREYMAGIGVKLTNIYKKNTLTTDIIGVGYSTVVTIAPYYKGTVFLYSAVYFYFLIADSITV